MVAIGAFPAAALAGGITSITQRSIATAGLGLKGTAYTRAFGEKPTVTRYADGTSRLSFSKAEVSVFLGRGGRGVVISTAAPDYVLSGGVHACGELPALLRAHRGVSPRRVSGAFGTQAVVYRLGRLWFTTVGTRIGRIALAAHPSLRSLLNDAQCGVGEPEGSG
jgi:hypothetical protein